MKMRASPDSRISVAVAVAVAVAITTLCSFFSAAAEPGPTSPPIDARAARIDGGGPATIGEPRPALELDVIDGSFVNDGRTAGRPMIVEFCATWCQPCHKALADILEVRKQVSTQPQLVLVHLGEQAGVVKQWAATATLPGDAILAVDPNGSAARRWGARRLPTTFIVDARGVVRHINRGWGTGYRDRVLRWLRSTDTPKP